MCLWRLFASGASAFLLALYLFLDLIFEIGFIKKYVNTDRRKHIIMYTFLAIASVILLVFLVVILEDENEAAMEIISFIIYLVMLYFILKFIQEYKHNAKLMKNQIYIYSYKLLPMLRYQSTGSGAQGHMIENNLEYFYFFVCSTQFMFWTLMAGILLDAKSRYIGFSLSALGMIIIYLYIETRMHQGKSFTDCDILIIEREHYLELQEQALLQRDMQQSAKQETVVQEDKQGLEAEVMRSKDTIMKCHKEWKSLWTIMSQKCHSAIKCGSEDVAFREEPSSQEIQDELREFDRLNTLREKTLLLHKTGKRVDQEYYNHIRYKAYMKGLITLKINRFMDELCAAVDGHLNEMRQLLMKFSNDERLQVYGARLTSLAFQQMSEASEYDEFIIAYREYKKIKLERDRRLYEQRKSENKMKQQRHEIDNLKYMREEEERRRYEEELRRLQYLEEQADQERRRQLIVQEHMQRVAEQEKRERERESRLRALAENQIPEDDGVRASQYNLYMQMHEKYKELTDDYTQESDGDMYIESDIMHRMQQEFDQEGDRIYQKYGNQGVFKDRDFRGEDAIHGMLSNETYGVKKWLRIQEMNDNDGHPITRPEVITKGLGANDIGQGAVGNCWFLSALSVVAYIRPDLLKNLIHKQSRFYRNDGVYVVRFFKMGYHKIVYVDDSFPCNSYNRSVF